MDITFLFGASYGDSEIYRVCHVLDFLNFRSNTRIKLYYINAGIEIYKDYDL